MASSAEFDPESGSLTASLTSNSCAKLMKKQTFSGEIDRLVAAIETLPGLIINSLGAAAGQHFEPDQSTPCVLRSPPLLPTTPRAAPQRWKGAPAARYADFLSGPP